MIRVPEPRPLLPVLTRMSLGLALALVGAVVTWHGISVRPTPGLQAVSTLLDVPLDGPLPGDLVGSATLRFEGNRANIRLGALGQQSPALLRGEASHRARNPVKVTTQRQGSNVNYTVRLYVKSLKDQGVVVTEPEPYQHQLAIRLSPSVPLSLSTFTVGGNQTLNLQTLRVRALTARSDSGRTSLTLPGRPGGPYAVVSRSGRVEVSALPGASPEALRINSVSGDLDLKLAGAVLDVLNAGTLSGNIQVIVPEKINRGSLTTLSGNVTVTVPRLSAGNLDIRTQSGNVSLSVPPQLRVRVRFTDRDTLLLPPGTPAATAPQLDIFVDTSSGKFKLNDPALPSPSSAPAANPSLSHAQNPTSPAPGGSR
ncbi:DUF4097 family beta strand repeat-containing protein [Deinococcus sp.]|uniref:DUF4097 family beta strand repeat-containing protein n=1 Tax=Deinococcus sp. TaxID=47478 RepID=UPI0025C2EF3A|nr:DUF4097 family beta strand repeat-containing protein [Deinococcus sp.]